MTKKEYTKQIITALRKKGMINESKLKKYLQESSAASSPEIINGLQKILGLTSEADSSSGVPRPIDPHDSGTIKELLEKIYVSLFGNDDASGDA